MTDTQKNAKGTTRTGKSSSALTEEELAALKETVQERKASARRGSASDKAAEDEREVLAKIAEMATADRVLAERIHAIASAASLAPRTWYGMPAYANGDGKIICFFTPAQKFKERYASFGFQATANLDEGAMWPTSWALTQITAATEAKIAELIKKAVS